ncbi:MAG: multiheme c-type cytochrome [Candidatus Zixiibacteriota bacterium]
MSFRWLSVMFTAVAVLAFTGSLMAQEAAKTEPAKHQYVGVKACKLCHKKDGIFDSWSATAHATAFDKLSEEDKKNEALKPYYTTGTTAEGELLTGVQCEVCHGPGSDYKKKSVMESREASVAAGLLIPDAKTCAKCHNDKAPAKLAATAKDFDFAKLKEKGAHAAAIKTEAAK